MKKHLPVKQFREIKKTFAETKQNGFKTTVNARIVHEWLGVGRDFNTWIRARIEKYGFEEHLDYCIVESLSSPDLGSAKSRRQKMKDYHCTPDMVKQLAMVESTEKGRLARLYFLDCEIVATQKIAELEARQKLKVEFTPMTDAVRDDHEDPQHYHYTNEADMINRIVLGCSSKQFRDRNGIGKNDSVRDCMTELQMTSVIELQRMNTVLIRLGNDFKSRKDQLKKYFDATFSQPLIDEAKRIEA